MKRNKKLLASIVAVVLSLTIVFATACTVTRTLTKLTADTTNAKTTYLIGEAFTYEGLVVTVDSDYSDGKHDAVTVTNYTVDSASYNNTVAGTYTINLSYTESDQTVTTSYNVEVLASAALVLDATSAQTLYTVGETVSTTGVTVKYVETKGDGTSVETDVTSSVTFVTTGVDTSVAGYYQVTASYTSPAPNSIRATGSYTVSIVEEKVGLDVALAEGEVDTIELTQANATATIDVSKITVTRPDKYGNLENGTAVAATDYEVSLYKVKEELTATEGTTYSNLGSGVYQVVVTAELDLIPVWGFALIYVVDNATTLTLTNADDTFEQQAGRDTISEQLEFEVEYGTGTTKSLTAEDVTFTTPIDTSVVGTDKTAVAVYKEVNEKGEEITTSEVTITYTITERVLSTSESFLIEELESMEQVEAGGTVTTNGLFEMKTEAIMQFDDSLKDKHPTMTLNEGTDYKGEQTYTVSKGLKQKDATAVNTDLPAITFTAQRNITIAVSVTISNDSYNSDRKGPVKYTIDGAGLVSTNTNGRDDMQKITVDLDAGQVLRIYYTCPDNTDATKTGKLWFFGAQAEARITATTYTFDYSAIPTEGKADEAMMVASDFTGVNAFIVPVEDDSSNYVKYRTADKGNCIQVRRKGATVTFEGTGTITIAFASTGGNNDSYIRLLDNTGAFLVATSNTATSADNATGTYNVHGTTYVTVTFTITSAGVYTIEGSSSRDTRINAITMVDNF